MAKLDLLYERLDGTIAILGRLSAEVDQVTRVAKDAGEAVRGQFVRIQRASPPARYGLPNHCMLFFTKIWTTSQWMLRPRWRAF